MVKWINFVLFVIAAAFAAWYFGAIQTVVEAFDAWLKYIGAK